MTEPSPSDLTGRVVLVTGVAQGIGKAIASACHSAGATVVGIDRAAAGGGHPWVTHKVDVTEGSAVERVLKQVVSDHGGVDCLVNNAAISHKAPLGDLDEPAWDAMQAVNIKAPVLLVRAVLPWLREGASIVNISSIRGSRGFANDVAYLASKGGLEQATRGLAVELGPRGVRVNAVAPGAIETPMNVRAFSDHIYRQRVVDLIPLGRLGLPEDVAAAVVFLASPAAGFITGAVLAVDGGQSAAG